MEENKPKKQRKPRKPQVLDFVCYVLMPDRGPVLVEDLTPEEHAQWQRNMRRRLSESMSDYCTQHPDELQRLIDAGLAPTVEEYNEQRARMGLPPFDPAL